MPSAMKAANDKPQDDARARRKVRIFISYSRRQTAWVESLVAALEGAHGEQIECRFDKRDLPYGEAWQNELDQMIRWADAVVFAVSPSAIESKWCRWELSRVTLHSKRLIPIQIVALDAGQEQPPEISAIQVIPAVGSAVDAALLETLVDTALSDRAWITTHTRLAEQAMAWAADGSKDRLLRGSALHHAETWRSARPLRAPELSKEQLDYIVASESASKQRTWRLTGALAFIAVLLLGLALMANDQRQKATTQEGIAREREAAASAAAREEAKARGNAERSLATLLKDKAHEAWRNDRRDEALAYMVEAYGAGAREPGDRLALGAMAAGFDRQISRLPQPGNTVDHAVLSRNGDRLLTCHDDRMARLWDVGTGRQLQLLRPAAGKFRACQLSADGALAITTSNSLTGSDDAIRKLWKAGSESPVADMAGFFSAPAFTRNAEVILEPDDEDIKRRDSRTGRLIEPQIAHGEHVLAADLDPDSGQVLSAGKTRVLLADRDGRTRALPPPAGVPAHAFFSRQGARLVVRQGGRWALVDALDGREVAVLATGLPETATVQVSADRSRIAARTPQALQLWDSAQGTPAGKASLPLAPADVVAGFDAGMTRVLIATGARLSLRDTASGREISGMDCQRCDNSVLSGDGATVATFKWGSLPTLWAFARPGEERIVKVQPAANEAAPEHLAEFDSDSMTLRLKSAGPADARCDLQAHELNDEGALMRALLSCKPAPRAQTIGYYGSRLAALPVLSGDARFLALPNGVKDRANYNVPHVYRRTNEQFELLRPLPGLKAMTEVLQFDGTAAQLLAADKTEIVIWDLATGDVTARFEGHADTIKAAAFDASDRLVASASQDKTLRLWSRASGRQLASIKTPAVFSAVAFDPANPARLTAWVKEWNKLEKYDVTLPYETRPYPELKAWAERVSPFAVVDGVAVRRSGFGAARTP